MSAPCATCSGEGRVYDCWRNKARGACADCDCRCTDCEGTGRTMSESKPVEWLWYGEDEGGKTHVSFGRWQKHPCQHRYKYAVPQATEHDHEKPRIASLESALASATSDCEMLREALERIAKETTIHELFRKESRIMCRDAMILHARAALQGGNDA